MSTTTSPHPTVDADLELLSGRAAAWAGLPVAEKRALLARLHEATAEVAGEWASLACRAKGLAPDSPLAGEEWMSGPMAQLVYTTALGRTLDALAAGRSPVKGRVGRAPGNRPSLRVRMPFEGFDRLLLSGYRAELWMEPGVTPEEVGRDAGLRTRRPDGGGVALVLGAGNIAAIAPLDVLYKLYADGRVVLLKLNPVNDYLLGVLVRAFAPFIDAGFVRIVAGGAELGGYLTGHSLVDEVHLTGSGETHDAIVFGGGAEGLRRKTAGRPALRKPMTSELGGVAPVIVLPGKWSDADLRFQAENVATQRLHNSGFNCNATQVVVLAAGWPQKDAFVEAVRAAVRNAPARPAYYPGADERQDRARSMHPGAEALDTKARRTLIEVDSRIPDDAFTTEYFSPVLSVTELPGGGDRAGDGDGDGPDAGAFLAAAVEFANDRLYGTLTANLIGDPTTLRGLGGRLDELIAGLRYGLIGVNCWSGLGFLTPRASWGAFPGHTVSDIESGIGVVHNALLLDRVERTVIRGPFRPSPRALVHGELHLSPKPPWFVTNRTSNVTGRRLTAFAAKPRLWLLPGILISALRG